MKKVKFTLGLMLAILMLGSNVANAEELPQYRQDKKSEAVIDYTFSMTASTNYMQVANVLRDYTYNSRDFYWPFAYVGNTTAPTTLNRFNVDSLFFALGNDTTAWRDPIEVRDTVRYSWISPDADSAVWRYSSFLDTTHAPRLAVDGWDKYMNYYTGINGIKRKGTDLRNDIIVELLYTDGNFLTPVLKRTIGVGEWYYDEEDEVNKIRYSHDIVEYFTQADSATTRALFDRGAGVARYVFSHNIIQLADKYPICSIHYELNIHGEMGSIIGDPDPTDPPVLLEPENMRGLTFEILSNLETSIPNTFGNVFYIPSYKHFTFTVYSTEDIEVTTNRNGDYSGDGVKIEKSKEEAGAYLVTIQKVQSNFNIRVAPKSDTQSTGGDDGTTGNEGPAGDAVWAAGGTLYVNAATPGVLNIYTVTGQLYRTETVSGSYTLSLPKGLYLVQFNGKTYKVIP